MPTALPSRSWVAGGGVALLRHAAAARVATCRASAVTRFRNTSRTPSPHTPQDSGRTRILFRGAGRDGAARCCPPARSPPPRDKQENRRASSFIRCCTHLHGFRFDWTSLSSERAHLSGSRTIVAFNFAPSSRSGTAGDACMACFANSLLQ